MKIAQSLYFSLHQVRYRYSHCVLVLCLAAFKLNDIFKIIGFPVHFFIQSFALLPESTRQKSVTCFQSN